MTAAIASEKRTVCVSSPGEASVVNNPLASFDVLSPSGVFDDYVQGDQYVANIEPEPEPGGPNGKIIPIGSVLYPVLLIGSPQPWWWLVVQPEFPQWGFTTGQDTGYGVYKPKGGSGGGVFQE